MMTLSFEIHKSPFAGIVCGKLGYVPGRLDWSVPFKV